MAITEIQYSNRNLGTTPDTIDIKSLCIFSYNSRGFNTDKQDICKTIMMNSATYFPILCNQENFLLHGNRYKIKQCIPNARIFFKKAVKNSIDGRPKNGMFIAVASEIKELVTDVSPSHWRVQAVIIKANNRKILIINSYFPTDPRVNSFDTNDLLATLSSIDNTLKDNDFDDVIWTGDINTDFDRESYFTKAVDTFVEEKFLMKAWDRFPIDFTHTCEVNEQTYTSTLDHFFWSKRILNNVTC